MPTSDPTVIAPLTPASPATDATVEPVQVRTLAGINADATVLASPPGDSTATPERVNLQQRFAPIGVLGKGAMGEVLIARDTGLSRKVALKRMLPSVAHNPALAARFFEEIQVTAQLDHPNVVPIYTLEVGDGGVLSYAMKLVQGKTLTQLLDDARRAYNADGKVPTPFNERERLANHLEIFLKVCDGMAYAHSKGVLHRDLKPDNIMVGRYNEVYVMDWGICRIMNNAEPEPQLMEATGLIDTLGTGNERTQVGTLIGTPSYMSPEQAMGLNPTLDARSDIYTLGLILQELVTLQRAMRGDNLQELLRKAAQADRQPVEHINAKRRIPAELKAIIAKATAPGTRDRYVSASELATDIRRFLRGEAVIAKPDTPLQATLRFISRHRAASLATIITLALLGAAVNIGLLWKADRERLAAQVHEQQLAEFLAMSSRQREAIDAEFFRYNGALERFVGQVTQMLIHPPAPQPYYQTADFDARRPPDLVDSTFSRMPVSLRWPSIKLAPGVTAASVEKDLFAFSALGPAFESLMLRSQGLDPERVTREQAIKTLTVEGTPILRAFISLANGAHCGYPGHGNLPDSFDGRTRPKYLLAANTHGLQWGNPYPDRYGSGLLLPAAVALYDEQQTFLGVAGLDITFQHLISHVLDQPLPAYVKETLLVDGKGQIIIRTPSTPHVAGQPWGDARDVLAHEDPNSNAIAALPTLKYPTVVQAMNGDRFGYQLVPASREVVAYFPLEALGWYYVVVADSTALFGR